MATISVIVHTKNSAATLEACLNSVQSLADELIVMDMGSTDDTLKIARQFKATILTHPDVGYADPARNQALQAATQDWILVVDSDEEIPPSLASKILELVNQPGEAKGYAFPRKNLICGRWAKSGWWPDYQRRLYQKGHVNWPPELHGKPQIDGLLVELPAKEAWAMLHHNYEQIDDFVDRAQRYSAIAAQEFTTGQRTPRPSLVSTYLEEITKRWFVDDAQAQGRYGQTLAMLQGFFEVLSLAKMWEQTDFPAQPPMPRLSDELWLAARNARYWEAHQAWEKAHGLARLYWRIRMRWKI